MKCKLFLFLFLALVLSCQKKSESPNVGSQQVSPSVSYQWEGNDLLVKTSKSETRWNSQNLPIKRAVVLNASLIGYFLELGLESSLVGVSSPEYIYSSRIHKLLESGQIQNVGSEQKYDLERILALKPQVIFTNYISTFENTYTVLKQSGIKIVFLDEYLENEPLDKSKYLLVFGALFGLENESKARYEEIEQAYKALVVQAQKQPTRPLVITNELYGNQWFMPGGKTQFAAFMKDAGAKYLLESTSDTKALPLSFEQVLVEAKTARLWVNAGNYNSKSEMLALHSNYTKLEVFNEGKIYAISGRTQGKANDFFESGVVRADLVLKDYIQIVHPGLISSEPLRYFKELH